MADRTYRESEHRPKVTPPHVPLRALRIVSGKTLEQVCADITEILGLADGKEFSRGSLSAIESGSRGPSAPVLRAIAQAYGLDATDLRTDFVPRDREYSEPVVA